MYVRVCACVFVCICVFVCVSRFCRGCTIPCDYGQVGHIGKFIAIDWNETAFHLKYVMAQERVRLLFVSVALMGIGGTSWDGLM